MEVVREQQKQALELKFLLNLVDQDREEAVLNTINKLYPFTEYPLSKMPPLLLQQYAAEEAICSNLKLQLQEYFYVIVVGKVKLTKGIFSFEEYKFLSQDIQQKLHFQLAEGQTSMAAMRPTTLLKVHNIWLQIAKKEALHRRTTYIQSKLQKIPFFLNLPFPDFNRVVKQILVRSLGPEQQLIQEGSIPTCMYVVAQGQFGQRKRVSLRDQPAVWQQVKAQLQKKDPFCQQLYSYLVREPTAQSITVLMELRTVGQGTIVCGGQTLSESPMQYSIVSNLKSTVFCIKYLDLYLLNTALLAEIRAWPRDPIDTVALRKQYYRQLMWEEYKEQLHKEAAVDTVHRTKLEHLLRTDAILDATKYTFSTRKVSAGSIVDSPASKMYRIIYMSE